MFFSLLPIGVPHMISLCMRFVTLLDYSKHYMLHNFLHDYVSTLDQPAMEEISLR